MMPLITNANFCDGHNLRGEWFVGIRFCLCKSCVRFEFPSSKKVNDRLEIDICWNSNSSRSICKNQGCMHKKRARGKFIFRELRM